MQTQTAKQSFITLDLATNLLQNYGSPLYVYSKTQLLANIKQLQNAANGYHLSYAMKANNNPQILQTIRNNGLGIKYVDVVSPGQIIKALDSGYQPSDILYTENFINNEQIDFALDKSITLNIGALSTLQHFAQKLKNKSIFIRINPNKGAGQHYKVITGGPQSKFGISQNDLNQTLTTAEQYNIKIIGLHQHIGSNFKKKDHDVFIQTTKYIFEKSKLFPHVKYINIGGGFGVKYRPQQQLMDLYELFQQVKSIRDTYNKQLQLWIEPGRFIVANTGILLCRVTARKSTSLKTFYGTDTGFNHLIRPALYGSHHNIINLNVCELAPEKATICGNICECSDNLGVDIMISAKIGDILCIENAGAYGYAMSSNYNERPRPAQIMLEDSIPKLIRRRQTYQDMKVKL